MIYRNLLIVLAFSLLAISLNGQRDPMRYGRIDHSDLEMQYYKADTAANALILGDYGIIKINYNNTQNKFEHHFTRHLRIKVFKAAGFDLGNFKIPVYKGEYGEERVSQVKASTHYLENGRVVKSDLSRRDVYTEQFSSRYNQVRFSVPDLREGCVIEVEYNIISDLMNSLPKWEFQHDIPAIFSELHVYFPEYFRYNRQMRGFLQLASQSSKTANQTINLGVVQRQDRGITANQQMARISYQENQEFFRMEEIPAFRREPYMDHPVNYVAHIEFELRSINFPHAPIRDYTSTWQQINTNLLNSIDFGEQLKRSGTISNEARQIKALYEDPIDRMKAAYNLVQKEMSWNGLHSIYATTNVRQAWNTKTGNVADINLLLVLLLSELELDASPVILSARSFGKVFEWQTTLRKFNYVIAHVQLGDEIYLLDATEKNMPWYLLPERAINGNGRIISSRIDKAGWVNLEDTHVSRANEVSTILIKNTGNYEAIVMQQLDNYFAYNLLSKIKNVGSMPDYIGELERNNPGLKINELSLDQEYDWSVPLELRYRIENNENGDEEKEFIYINPFIMGQLESNPFRAPERLFPVNFTYPRKHSYTFRFSLPLGYAVDELPEPMAIKLENRSCFFSYHPVAAGQQVQITIELEVNKAFFSFEEYDLLREFFAYVVEKQAEMIVLKKVG